MDELSSSACIPVGWGFLSPWLMFCLFSASFFGRFESIFALKRKKRWWLFVTVMYFYLTLSRFVFKGLVSFCSFKSAVLTPACFIRIDRKKKWLVPGLFAKFCLHLPFLRRIRGSLWFFLILYPAERGWPCLIWKVFGHQCHMPKGPLAWFRGQRNLYYSKVFFCCCGGAGSGFSVSCEGAGQTGTREKSNMLYNTRLIWVDPILNSRGCRFLPRFCLPVSYSICLLYASFRSNSVNGV